jgi:hypothetical protein
VPWLNQTNSTGWEIQSSDLAIFGTYNAALIMQFLDL